MGTQAVVSVTVNGETRMKIVAGLHGYLANRLARALPNMWFYGVPAVHTHALQLGFGSWQDLVTMDRDHICYLGPGLPGADYVRTFDDPEWNPRWHYGTADYVVVVRL